MARARKIKPETLFFPKKLMERLGSIKTYPLTLVEAPSGFGKTTALRHLFDSQISKTAQVIWHTVGEEQPGVSWKNFCALIAQFDVEGAERLMVAGAPDEDTIPEIERIFRELSCPEETYLVLDDFALWKLPDFGRFLTALSAHGGSASCCGCFPASATAGANIHYGEQPPVRTARIRVYFFRRGYRRLLSSGGDFPDGHAA